MRLTVLYSMCYCRSTQHFLFEIFSLRIVQWTAMANCIAFFDQSKSINCMQNRHFNWEMNDKTLFFASSYPRGLIFSFPFRLSEMYLFYFHWKRKENIKLNRANKDDQKSRHHLAIEMGFFSFCLFQMCIDSKLSMNNRSQCHIMKCKYLFFIDQMPQQRRKGTKIFMRSASRWKYDYFIFKWKDESMIYCYHIDIYQSKAANDRLKP